MSWAKFSKSWALILLALLEVTDTNLGLTMWRDPRVGLVPKVSDHAFESCVALLFKTAASGQINKQLRFDKNAYQKAYCPNRIYT